jgi:glycosyltransferase involved in cell wall biosynthesis
VKFLIILPDLRGGGAERLHINLAKDWVKRGHSVEFFLMRKQGQLLSILPREIKVVSAEVVRIRNFILPIKRYLNVSKPDVVLSAMWPLTSITVLAWVLSGKQCKLFLSEHVILSASIVRELFLPLWLVSSLLKITYPLASGIVAVSRSVKNDLCILGKFSCDYIKVINNPIVADTSLNNGCDGEIWGEGYDCHILSVGALKFEKNYKSLILAFSHIFEEHNAKLIILGDGDERNNLEDLILKLGLQDRVLLPGFVLDPYPWYSSADLFVLSSLWEGFGNVIVEALEQGVPVVSTDSGGPSEILKDGFYGKLVKIDDYNALSTAMNESLCGSHDSNFLINRAQDFSISRISTKYLNYFKKYKLH